MSQSLCANQRHRLRRGGATTATRAAASNVGSLSGDVVISAAQTYNQIASNIVAPQGNIDIAAKTVNITEARETSNSQTEQQFKQSGVSVSVSKPIVNVLHQRWATTKPMPIS